MKLFARLLILLALICSPAMASQNSTTLPTVSPYPGLTMLNNINSAFNTFQTNFSGSSAPSSPTSDQFWADTSSNTLKYTPDATNWYPVGSFASGWVVMSNGFKQTAVTSTGSSNAYIVTYSPAPSAYATGQTYRFITNFSNTGAATVNVNSIGAIALKKEGSVSLSAGDLSNGAAVECVYDGTTCQITSELSQASTGTVTSVATNNGITGGPITSSGTIGLAPIGSSTVLANVTGSSAVPVAVSLSSLSPTIPSTISGLVPSSISGSSTTAAVSISAGSAEDSTSTAYLRLSTNNWSVTNGNAINGYQGGTTLPSSSTINWFVCSGTSGTGSFASTSLTPTCPSGYNSNYRRIFSDVTDGSGNPLPYNAMEGDGGSIVCMLNSPAFDFNSGPFAPTNLAVTAPNDINIVGKFNISIAGSGGTQTRSLSLSYSPSASPIVILTTGAAFSGNAIEANIPLYGDRTIYNLASGGADTGTVIYTLGWSDPRRN